MKSVKSLQKQQKDYQAKAKKLAEYKRLLAKETEDAAKRLKRMDPAFRDFGEKITTVTYVRPAKGAGKSQVIMEILKLILADESADKKQAELLREAQERFPHIKIWPNLWNRELYQGLKKQIREKVNASLPEAIDLSNFQTLAEVRKTIYARRKTATAAIPLKKRINISKHGITIGNTYYPTQIRNKGKSIQKKAIRVTLDGKRHWLNYKPLCALLMELR